MDKILIIGPSWVGDMIMAQSLFIALKNKYDNLLIDVVAPEWSIPVIERMPEVNNAISIPVKHKQLALITRYKTAKNIRKNNYQQAIVIPRSLKSALIPFFAKIPKRTGYRGEMRYGLLNDIRALDKSILTKTVQRYVNLANSNDSLNKLEIPYPKLSVDVSNRKKLIEQLHLKTGKPIIGLMPGAEYGPAKQWPYFKELAVKLVEHGYRVWIFGSNKDKKIGSEIGNVDSENIVNLCGKTQLVDAIDLISLTGKVVTNDSGLMHMAAAVSTPLVAIYGSSTPDYTPPLTDKLNIVYKKLDCSPCFKRVCPLGHTNCLYDISVNDVLTKII